tara:strand:+ start:1149 stop:1871 length:723 start_codon:yes stop_codon:yes gene_type:complete
MISKKVLNNLVFIFILCLFNSIFFFDKRGIQINQIEIKYINDNNEYVSEADVMIQIDKFFNSNSLNDINTRLLEDSVNALTNIKNAEVYLSLNNNLTVLIQQETPFIGIKNNGKSRFFTKDSVELNLVETEEPNVLFFDDEIREIPWQEAIFLSSFLYENEFLNNIVDEVSYDEKSNYILKSCSLDFNINIGNLKKLEEKVSRIKLFFKGVYLDKRLMENNKLAIKELNVAYDNQIVCIK